MGDHVIMSRYILQRIAEMNEIQITFINPECLRDTILRSALHLNFSTRNMRGENGIVYVDKILKQISLNFLLCQTQSFEDITVHREVAGSTPCSETCACYGLR